MRDTIVRLDDIEFMGFEVPETIPFGGSQALSIKKHIGGARTMDSMGADDRPLEWSGRFRGPEALSRARALDAKRKAGLPLKLTWGELAFTVKIALFHPVFEKAYEIPYSISCEVITDDAAPLDAGSTPNIDDMVGDDMASVTASAGRLGNAGLTGAVATLQSTISRVRSFVAAPISVLSAVIPQVSAVENAAQGIFDSAQAVLGGPASLGLGGVVSGFGPNQLVANLLGSTVAMIDSADAFDAQSFSGRLMRNVTSIGSAGVEVVVAGADLFDLSRRAYGDATEWATIARANGLTDPLVMGIATLRIPPTPGDTGGVLAI
jgi:prophage DNA circulation protein